MWKLINWDHERGVSADEDIFFFAQDLERCVAFYFSRRAFKAT